MLGRLRKNGTFLGGGAGRDTEAGHGFTRGNALAHTAGAARPRPGAQRPCRSSAAAPADSTEQNAVSFLSSVLDPVLRHLILVRVELFSGSELVSS